MTTSEATARPEATNQSGSSETLSWSYTVATSRFLRALVALPLGVLAALSLAVGGGVAALLGASLLAGNYLVALGVLAVALVAAVRAGPLLAAQRSEWSSRSPLLSETVRQVGWRGLTAASLSGLGILWTGLQFGRVGLVSAVVATVVVPALAVSVLSSEGELDRNSSMLTYCGTEVDLASLDGFRRVSVGPFDFYRLSYVSGAMSIRTPRFLVTPAAVGAAVREAVTAGVDSAPPEYDPPNRAVRATLVAFGLGCLALGGLLLTVDPTSSNPRGGVVLVYAVLFAGLFGLIFLWLALRAG